MTDEKIRALIAEARKHLHYPGTPEDNWCMRCAEDWPCVTRRLADALSALTVPDGDARERLKAEALKNWQAGVKIRRYSEFFTSFEDGFDRGYAAALSRDIAGEIEAEAKKPPRGGLTSPRDMAYQDGLRRAAEIARNGR